MLMKNLFLLLLVSISLACCSCNKAVAWTMSPTANSGSGYSNPTNAYDNNLQTTTGTASDGAVIVLSGFSNQGQSKNIVLHIRHSWLSAANPIYVSYSINGGVDWTVVITKAGVSGGPETETATIPNVNDTSQIQIKAEVVGALVLHSIYEVWLTGDAVLPTLRGNAIGGWR